MKTETPQQIWKRAYRYARLPDSMFADNTVVDVPALYLYLAMEIFNFYK